LSLEVTAVRRVSMVVVCLVAALSGIPLRQAEAASDFMRSVAELGEEPGIEVVDGGVGDDSGATVLTVRCDHNQSRSEIGSLVTAPGHLTALRPGWACAVLGLTRLVNHGAVLSAGSVPRHIWLQFFLF
jgi:hypothetical protein